MPENKPRNLSDALFQAFFREHPTALKIKKQKIMPHGQPLPPRVTDKDNHVIGYPVLQGDKIVLSRTPNRDRDDPFKQISYTSAIGQHDKKLGKGAFGSVKAIVQNPQHKASYCFKSQLIKNLQSAQGREERDASIKMITSEFETLKDLGLADGPLIERETARGTKFIFRLKDLGPSLTDVVDKTPIDDKLDIVIGLLLKVDALHTGQASSTHQPYAHRDIKPANLTRDKDGRVHLIDFGAAVPLVGKPDQIAGSPYYLPVDIAILQKPGVSIKAVFDAVVSTTNAEKDTIATFRSIYHPIRPRPDEPTRSILNQREYQALPKRLQEMMNTKKIEAFLKNPVSLRMLAASIAFYKLFGSFNSADEERMKSDEFQRHILTLYEARGNPDTQSHLKTLAEAFKLEQTIAKTMDQLNLDPCSNIMQYYQTSLKELQTSINSSHSERSSEALAKKTSEIETALATIKEPLDALQLMKSQLKEKIVWLREVVSATSRVRTTNLIEVCQTKIKALESRMQHLPMPSSTKIASMRTQIDADIKEIESKVVRINQLQEIEDYLTQQIERMGKTFMKDDKKTNEKCEAFQKQLDTVKALLAEEDKYPTECKTKESNIATLLDKIGGKAMASRSTSYFKSAVTTAKQAFDAQFKPDAPSNFNRTFR